MSRPSLTTYSLNAHLSYLNFFAVNVRSALKKFIMHQIIAFCNIFPIFVPHMRSIADT